MEIIKEKFGLNEEKKEIYKYTVTGENICASFCETGAAIMCVKVAGSDNVIRDVVLGLEGYEDYRRNWPSFGAVIGRYANRISKARFKLNDKKFVLKKNIKGGCLHSGFSYHYRDWKSESFVDETGAHIIFYLNSEDGDQGFPGNLKIKVEYVVSEEKSLCIRYQYVSDADTIVNLTNHCYFNLDGHESGSIMNQKVQINSTQVTSVDKKLMPTGEIVNVEGSAFDFTKLTTINDNLSKSFKPIAPQNEYDINYVISDKLGEYKLAVLLEAEHSGIGMKVYTNMPGMQFYTGNAVNGYRGKGGVKYSDNPGVCFETQFYPDAVNIKKFPSPIIKADTIINTETKYEFYVI